VALRYGLLYLRTGRYAEAEPMLERSLALGEDGVGRDHPALLGIVVALADCYRLRNRPQDAAALYERFLTLGEATYGASAVALLPGLVGLAQAAERLGDDTRAAALYARAAAVVDGLDSENPARRRGAALRADFESRHRRMASRER
jgi:tetratricopeptide (TPR) repeat protein